jgi:CheY-like chemotaxis protein
MSDKRKILVVEDEADQREWIATLLADHGYKTITAENGQEGFEKASSERPDLITLDISMPEESGLRMYRDLNSDSELSSIPVIIITGVSTDLKNFLEKRKQVKAPAGFVEKPVDKNILLKTMKDILGT